MYKCVNIHLRIALSCYLHIIFVLREGKSHKSLNSTNMDHLSQLQKAMEDIKQLFESRMSRFEDSIAGQSNPGAADSSEAAGIFPIFKNLVWQAVGSLQAQLELVLRTLEDLEMRSRANILLLHGVPEVKDEMVSRKVSSLLQSKMQLNGITESSFIACHRLGKVKTGKQSRAILVKFACIRTRNMVWSAKKLLKGSGLTLSEFLTSSRHAVFLEARRVFGVKGSWTNDGRVVVLSADGARYKVTSMAELRAIRAPSDAAESGPTVDAVQTLPTEPHSSGATRHTTPNSASTAGAPAPRPVPAGRLAVAAQVDEQGGGGGRKPRPNRNARKSPVDPMPRH